MKRTDFDMTQNLNEINHDYCPDNDDSFTQYPIGDHRSLEQIEPIIQLDERVNFTAIEIAAIDGNEQMILLGDDHGTVYTVRFFAEEFLSLKMIILQFQTSNRKEMRKHNYPSSTIIDLQLINRKPLLKNAQLLVLTNNQVGRLCKQ